MLTNDNKSVAASETRHLFGLQSTRIQRGCATNTRGCVHPYRVEFIDENGGGPGYD